ncbi:unnamed protein product [Brassica napus]|uniref:(rape) hypothetical protein n=1 Tax=Brassica napus TaxID=3708 RepID=A0A816NQS4_BRANA|nr:unnamed protein product [Brassica napus]
MHQASLMERVDQSRGRVAVDCLRFRRLQFMSRRMLCRLWQNYPRRRRLLFVCPASLTLKVKLLRFVRGGSSSMCLLRRLCSASPAWRSGSTLRSFGSGYLARATASV